MTYRYTVLPATDGEYVLGCKTEAPPRPVAGLSFNFFGSPPRLVIDIKRKFTQVMCKIFLERPTIFINDISTLLVGFGALPPAPARDAGGAARCASAVGQYPGVPGDFFCVKTAAPPAPFVLPRGASEKPTTSRPSGRGRSWSALRNCCGSSPEAAMVTRNTAS